MICNISYDRLTWESLKSCGKWVSSMYPFQGFELLIKMRARVGQKWSLWCALPCVQNMRKVNHLIWGRHTLSVIGTIWYGPYDTVDIMASYHIHWHVLEFRSPNFLVFSFAARIFCYSNGWKALEPLLVLRNILILRNKLLPFVCPWPILLMGLKSSLYLFRLR